MAFIASHDPFLAAQDDLLSSLSNTQSLHSSYIRIRSIATSPSSQELTQARQELEAALQELATDLQDLVDSVRAVEGDPFKYGLEVEEVGRRRDLVRAIGDEVEKMRHELHGQSEKRSDNLGASLPSPSTFLEDPSKRKSSTDAYGSDEDDYALFEQQQQLEMMHEQEEQLDDVFKTVGNLRAQADTMGRELEEQAEMLQEVDTVADRVGGKLQTGMERVTHIIKKNEETFSSCCIGILILVLILLLVLVIIL